MKHVYILIFLIRTGLLLHSQNLNQPVFKTIDNSSLGVKVVIKAIASKSNFMWVHTDKGIGKYNGYRIQDVLTVKNGLLKSNKVLSLYEDTFYNLWFGYADYEAMTCYNPKTNTVIHFKNDSLNPNSLPKETVISNFYEDKKGQFWAGTWGAGILKFNSSRTKFKVINKKNTNNSLKSDVVRTITQLDDENYLLTFFEENQNGELCIFNAKKNTFKPFPIDDYLIGLSKTGSDEIKHILTISHFVHIDKEKMWVGTYSGLVLINTKTKTAKRISPRKFNPNMALNLENTFSSVVVDKNHLWVATNNSGIIIIDVNTEKSFYHKKGISAGSISDNAINSFAKDIDGNIWLATGSLNIYSPLLQEFKIKAWSDLKMDYSDASSQTMPLNKYILRNESSLYLSNLNGITHYDFLKDSIINYIKPFNYSLRNAVPNSIYNFNINKNEMYFLSSQIHNYNEFVDFSLYNIKTKEHKIHTKKPIFYVFSFFNDSSNSTYAFNVLKDTMLKINPTTKKLEYFYGFRNLLFNDFKYALVLKNNKLFLGHSQRGFVILDTITKKTKLYSSAKNHDIYFPDSLITSYDYNNSNLMYISTRNGIYSFDIFTEKIIKLNKEIGIDSSFLVNNVVASIKENNIWFTGSKELYKYNFTTKKLLKFDYRFGLITDGFDNNNRVFNIIKKNENIIIPCGKGLLMFNESKIKVPQNTPNLSVFLLKVKDSIYENQKLNQLLKKPLIFNHNENSLTFELCTPQLYSPYGNNFKYKLIGVDTAWINNETSNKISLQNLLPGNYRLIIKITNSYNIDSNELIIPIKIKPPFWKTWWFITLVVILIGSTFYIYIKYREKDIIKKQIGLENIIKERTSEIVNKAKELNTQKELIEEKQKEIVDSIKYAQRIQSALLASKSLLDKHLKNYFVYYNPKDIVSGDFYWAASIENRFYLIVADSTGHGVPGAFMSLLNISFLNEAINEKQIVEPSKILDYVRKRLIQNLAEDGSSEGGKDGMDCSLLCFDFNTNTLMYSCAFNPILIIRNNEILEYTSDRMPVGKSPKEDFPFTNYNFQLQPNDLIYIFTDGYADQFGGEHGKKLKVKNFKEFILKNHLLGLDKQHQLLKNSFNEWKGSLEQIDDVCVFALKIS